MKVTFDFAAGKIVVESDEAGFLKVAEVAKELAPGLKELVIRTEAAPKQDEGNGGGNAGGARVANERVPSMRDFIKKLPLGPTTSAYDKVAAIAYFVTKYEKRPSFSPQEMKGWFGLCGFTLPKQPMSVVMTDTRRFRGYVENRDRGQWTATTSAENLVLDLLEGRKGTEGA